MTQVTTTDIERIISGDPVEIESPCPLDGISKWYMAPPVDYLLNMADTARQAAVVQALAMPEMAALKLLPPTDVWIANQKEAIENNQKRIAELEAIEKRTAEQDIELATKKDLADRYIVPENYSRAEQLARETGNTAFNNYLVPRLVVDDDGHLLFDQNTAEGKRRWNKLRERDRIALNGTLGYLLLLVDIAKNS